MATIVQDIYVTVFFIASKSQEGFLLEEGLEYDDITNAIFEDEHLNKHANGELMLSVPNKLGWEYQLVDSEASKLSSFVIDVADLNDHDTIFIRVRNDRVGGRKLLTSLLNEHERTPVLKSRFKYLCSTYCGYRPMRHDGDDYFRAVYFALFESIIITGRREIFQPIIERFNHLLSEMLRENSPSTTLSPTTNSDLTISYINYVVRVLDEAVEGKRWMTVDELEADLLDPQYELDVMFVMVLRKLTTFFIMENRDMKLANNGTTSLEDIIMEAHPEYP